jgi:hypothetical protein
MGSSKNTATCERRKADRIIDHLKLTFIAAIPPPPHAFVQIALTDAEESRESLLCRPEREFATSN